MTVSAQHVSPVMLLFPFLIRLLVKLEEKRLCELQTSDKGTVGAGDGCLVYTRNPTTIISYMYMHI